MILRLGSCDPNAIPADKKAFLAPYHLDMKVPPGDSQFRDAAGWCDFAVVRDPIGKSPVRDLQQFLKDAGFMPKCTLNGIFGYETQAAVRLFQEYLRTVPIPPATQGDATIGNPDGVVGANTLAHIETWKTKNAGVCDWGRISNQSPTSESTRWIGLLTQVRIRFLAEKDTHPILKLIEQYPQPSDTKKVADWKTDADTIHLIGIRRGQERSVSRVRPNDDLFVLLINGMVFQFWGSVDPSPEMAVDPKTKKQTPVPFLVEGQHQYKFSWHHWGDSVKIYQALRPAGPGVMVFRDQGPDFDNALTEKELTAGLENKLNTTINIHWSGVGSTNFSAGCQVIAGNSYLNHLGTQVDCRAFAAQNQKDLLKEGKTRGAYNVFADLLLTYAPPGVRTIRYLLGHDETFARFGWDVAFIDAAVKTLSEGIIA